MTVFFPFVNGYMMRNQSSETRHSQQMSQLLDNWGNNRPLARVWLLARGSELDGLIQTVDPLLDPHGLLKYKV